MSDKVTAESLGYENNDVLKLINAIPKPNYSVNVRMSSIERTLKDYDENEGLELEPDFQRGHVWTQEQQIAYCESLVRGVLGDAGRTITFNAPSWATYNKKSDSDLDVMVCIDGLQRLTAVRKFYKKEFKIFDFIDGGVYWDFFLGTEVNPNTMGNGLIFQVFDMQYKLDVLNYYLAFNDGGTPHSKEEIQRIRAMRDELIKKRQNGNV